MIDANEFARLQDGQPDEKDFKLATVKSLFETGTAKIQFFGEEAPSEKEYAYLASYDPTVNDIVLVVPFADTYIIAGKILFQVSVPSESNITMEQVNAAITSALTPYAKTTDLNNYSTTSHTHTRLRATNGQEAGLFLSINGGNYCFVPSSEAMYMGYSGGYRWAGVYAVSGTINTSDERQKKDIKPLDERYRKFFKLLKPVTFKFKDGKRDHIGFTAQQVKKAMKKAGISSEEFAGYIEAPIYDGKGKLKGYELGLRYSEFTPLNTYEIQLHDERIEKLEKTVYGGENK